MQQLRARLLRFIIKSHFDEKYGDTDWWDNVLLLHMREEAQKQENASGTKYAIALRKYGRAITFDDLDTTVLSAIILYDPYFRVGKNAVSYSPYELSLVKQLHSNRNKISHEENDSAVSEEAEKKSIKLMRAAIDELSLMEKAPDLARDILTEYAKVFGLKGEGEDVTAFLELTGRFNEAESLYQWEIDKAIPIYKDLAEKGHTGAQKKLFFIYTHVVSYFDLNKALGLTSQYPKILPRDEAGEPERTIKKLSFLHNAMPHAIWGTPNIINVFMKELKSGKLVQNAQLLQYICQIHAEYPNGLLDFLDDNDLKALLFSKQPNLQGALLWTETHKTPDAALTETLVELTELREFRADHTVRAIKKQALSGNVPIIDFYAKRSMEKNAGHPTDDTLKWLQLGVKYNSSNCIAWLNQIKQRSEEQSQKTMPQSETQSSPDQHELEVLQKEVADLQKTIHKLKILIAISGGVILALLARLVL